MPTSVFLKNVEIVQFGRVVNELGESKNIVNRFTYACIDTPYIPDLAAMAVSWKALIHTAWIAFMPTGYLDNGMTIRLLDDATNVALEVVPGLGSGGVGTLAQMLDPCYSAYCKFETGMRGKNYRGSKHLSPLSETYVAQGNLDGGGRGLLTTLFATFLANFTQGAGTWFPTVMSQNLSQIAVNPVWIEAHQVDTALSKFNATTGTMRHRRFSTILN